MDKIENIAIVTMAIFLNYSSLERFLTGVKSLSILKILRYLSGSIVVSASKIDSRMACSFLRLLIL